MATQTYLQVFPASQPALAETKFAEDPLAGKFLLMQNNTAYDCNLLVWKEPYPTGKPMQLAVRAGSSVTYGGDLGYFQLFYAGTNGSGQGVKPAGFGGGYTGKGAITLSGVDGYFVIMAWDGPVPINIPQSNFSQVTAQIGGPIPAGANKIGSVDVASMPNHAGAAIGIVGNDVVNVGTARVQLPIPTGIRQLAIRNSSVNGDSVYIGSNSVTTANGFEIKPGESFSLEVNYNAQTSITVYAVAFNPLNVSILGVA